MRLAVCFALGGLLFAAISCSVAAQNKATASAKKTAELAPEMQKLSFLLGDWHYTQKYEKSPMMPEGGASEGIYRAAAGPGGHSLITDFEETTGPMAGISGHEVFTWDAEKSAFAGYTFASDGPGCFIRTGNLENDQLVFHREINVKGKVVRMRYVYTEARPDSVAIEVYMGMGDAPLTLAFTTKAKRQ